MRAIVSAVLFSAVVFGALYLLRRYIPEFKKASEGAQSTDGSDLGSKVSYAQSSEAESGDKTEAAADVEDGGIPSPEEVAASLEQGNGSPLQGDTGSFSAVTGTAESEVTAQQQGESGAFMESVQPLADAAEGSSLNGLEEITLGASEENGNGAVEDLPSLDKLYEEHEQVSVPDIGPSDIGSKDKSTAVGDYIEVGNARIPFEPEVLAKAVKKVMKEDE
jgi:hypothetical protein